MNEESRAYGRILKSSSIVGGAQGFNMLLGMVRVKFVAVLLGPAGLGLLGMFQTIQSMAGTLAGLGINSSGVRDVAQAAGTADEERIGRTVLTLRRVCWLTGLVGGGLLAALAVPLSHLSFQTTDYAGQIALLGLAVLMGSVAAGQMALIQGMRRIGDLAKLNMISSIAGTVVAVAFYSRWGLAGIVPALLMMSVIALAASFYFSRKVSVKRVRMSWQESFVAAGGLVSLGLAFMWSGLLGALAEYATRALITREVDLAAVGIFTAAFRLSGMFLNFVLGAMGADFYPSLTAVSEDHGKMRDLVNQQTEIGLLLAVPGLLATLALAPWVIYVFYTGAFAESAVLLQWFVLGCLGRVISWPMGFIMLAKGAGRLFAIFESGCQIFHIGLIWCGLKWIGVEGVAIAFFLLYICCTSAVLCISRRLIDFRWSPSVYRLLFILLPIAFLTMAQSRFLPLVPSTAIGMAITLAASIYCLRNLCSRLGRNHRIVKLVLKMPLSGYWIGKAF